MLAALLIAAAAACHTGGAAPLVLPDSRCTPGSRVALTKAQACTPTDRPTTPASVRREVLTQYGVPGWSGRNGEIDHRVPWFLTHDSSENNLWPEPGAIPNPKDRLEGYVYLRVCHGSPRPMRTATARRIFRGNWVRWYRFYFSGASGKGGR
jgi:hypothetical protein